MNKNPIKIHQLYNKHAPREICRPAIHGQHTAALLYCSCGLFWLGRQANPVWDSAYDKHRASIIRKAVAQLADPVISQHWLQYRNHVRRVYEDTNLPAVQYWSAWAEK